MLKAHAFDFTTGSGSVSTDIMGLKQGGLSINNLSDLSSGSAKVEVFYNNSTGKKYLLHYIIAFYNGNEMVYSSYASDELSDYAVGQVSETVVTIPDVSAEYDEVNIIAWDNFNGMLPVSKSLVLK